MVQTRAGWPVRELSWLAIILVVLAVVWPSIDRTYASLSKISELEKRDVQEFENTTRALAAMDQGEFTTFLLDQLYAEDPGPDMHILEGSRSILGALESGWAWRRKYDFRTPHPVMAVVRAGRRISIRTDERPGAKMYSVSHEPRDQMELDVLATNVAGAEDTRFLIQECVLGAQREYAAGNYPKCKYHLLRIVVVALHYACENRISPPYAVTEVPTIDVFVENEGNVSQPVSGWTERPDSRYIVIRDPLHDTLNEQIKSESGVITLCLMIILCILMCCTGLCDPGHRRVV
jgi:hypothetical protein